MGKFGAVGVLNTTLDMGLFWLLHVKLGIPFIIANLMSYSVGVLNSFILNKMWTFVDTCDQGSIGRQLPAFLAINALSLGLSSLILWVCFEPMGVMTAKLMATVVSFLVNFWANRTFVFHSRADRARSTLQPH
jgi:putative flippase GtrA